jgi:N-acetylglucosaminyldiphosphoundecaprenol N-acetyl-beta-D-mannosaminyltransferase
MMIIEQLYPKILTEDLNSMPDRKLLINTINAHSYNVAKKDLNFLESLIGSDVLLADGVGVVLCYKLLNKRVCKIAGADLFYYQMKRLNKQNGSCFFLGSSESTLNQIKLKAKQEFPNIRIGSYSPPFKATFSEHESEEMINQINIFHPDVLFIGMTAPKQEKWAYEHFKNLNTKHICCIGAVFDFYAETVSRPPQWMINIGLEWLGRLLKEPKRMWHRYLVSSPVIIKDAIRYKFKNYRQQASL